MNWPGVWRPLPPLSSLPAPSPPLTQPASTPAIASTLSPCIRIIVTSCCAPLAHASLRRSYAVTQQPACHVRSQRFRNLSRVPGCARLCLAPALDVDDVL